MSTDFRLPNITAQTLPGQVQQIQSYLFQLVQQLEFEFNRADTNSQTPATQTQTSGGIADPNEMQAQAIFNSIKQLIIRSTDIIDAYYQKMSEKMKGDYVSSSDYQAFSSNTTASLKDLSKAIDPLADHIRAGILYRDTYGESVYGLEIGRWIGTGEDKTFEKYARFTDERTSFYEEELTEHHQKMTDNAWTLVDGVASLLGLPVKNVRRDILSYANLAKTLSRDLVNNPTSFWGEVFESVQNAIPFLGWRPDETKTDKLYKAITSGDAIYENRLKNSYVDKDGNFNKSKYSSAIRKALRENDPRIREAAIAWNSNNLDEYMRIAKEIIAENHFAQDDVVMAIRAEANGLAPDNTTSVSQAKSLFTADKFAEAVAQGDSATASAAKDDIIQTAQKNGKTADEAEKSFISSAKSSMKELFLAKGITETQAVNALVAYCGETGEEARKRVAEWAFEEEYGFAYGEKNRKFKDGTISAAELKGVLINVDGKTADEAASTIVSYSREGYEEGSFSRSETAELMMEYGGLTRTEAEAKLRYIDFKIANPDVYADDAWIDEYYEEVQSSGISINVFVEYRNTVKSMTGTNKKVQRMAVIDSLPISNDQKDALYYAEGWVSSRLYEAPWH